MSLKRALNARDCLTQFRSIFPIAGVSKRAEKLMRMSLQNGGAAPHHFPSLASGVAGCAQGAQAPLWNWPVGRLRPRARARCLACAIHIEDKEVIPLPIKHTA